jgi:hypothetical protein
MKTRRTKTSKGQGLSSYPEPRLTAEQIARAFELFGTVIPASTADATRCRTAYFYRKQAIEWAKMARQYWPGDGDMQSNCHRLAKAYLATYRRMKSIQGMR